MTLRLNDGTVVTTSSFGSTVTSEVDQPTHVLQDDVYEDVPLPGTQKRAKHLKWKAGTVLTDAEFQAATPQAASLDIPGVLPATGPAAGGQLVTVTGRGLLNATGVTFGGTAATKVFVENDTTIRCVTPAHAAGAVDVVVQVPEGNVTNSPGYTYV